MLPPPSTPLLLLLLLATAATSPLQQEEVVSEKEAVVSEKEAVVSEKEAVVSEKEAVVSEKEAVSAFEANRVSIIEWISNLVNQQQSGESNPAPPDPVDPSKCAPCTCGLTNQKNRIVGGKETQVNQYPWMALLTYNGNFYCGGSLLNSRYVLTAAHCVYGFRSTKIRVRLLEHDQKNENETASVERGVMHAIRHSGYNQNSLDHDIAILRLDEDVPLEGDLRPVCLPPAKKSFAGEKGIVTGWGVKQPSKARRGVSTTLQELEVPIMSNDQCKETGYDQDQITENMLCAGFKEGGKDSCQGDSGGPLHYANGTYHHIIGVVSWGMGCARPNYPGVYTRVNRYNPWIEKHTADSCYCQPTRY